MDNWCVDMMIDEEFPVPVLAVEIFELFVLDRGKLEKRIIEIEILDLLEKGFYFWWKNTTCKNVYMILNSTIIILVFENYLNWVIHTLVIYIQFLK